MLTLPRTAPHGVLLSLWRADVIVFLVCLCLLSGRRTLAAVDWSGDIDPDDPTTWTGDTNVYVGKTGEGTLTVDGGDGILSDYGCIVGYETGATGEVTVDGEGSTWTNESYLYVGRRGSGTLNITNGGLVTVDGDTYVAYDEGSSGAVHFDNGTLTTRTLLCASEDLTGTGIVNTHGLVSDVDLVFDAGHGMNQTLVVGANPGQNVTINLDVNGTGAIGVGYHGTAAMSIRDGITVGSTGGYIGYKSGSIGEVTVDGIGSTWTNFVFFVGDNGSGTLNITDGAVVDSHFSVIGFDTGSRGEVTVNGVGSTWMNNWSLDVGCNGRGELNITGGGRVSGSCCCISSQSEVTVSGVGSTWTSDSYLTINSGTLEILDGGAVSNDYCYIGYGSTGEVTVDGPGSAWTNSFYLHIGQYGSGTLSITHGGIVSVGGETRVGHLTDSSGTINFDNGTLTTGGLLCSFADLTGAGTIITHGLVSDVDLVFDATSGLNQIISIDSDPGQNITVILNVDGTAAMGAGYDDVGTMSICDGQSVVSAEGYIGYKAGATGAVTVDSAGSTWSNTSSLYVGRYGIGMLSITNSGAVRSSGGQIGSASGSTGTVTVDGAGSTWMSNSDLCVGYYGHGTLAITDGGTVSNDSNYRDSGYIGYNSGSTGEVNVDGCGSIWTIRNTFSRSGLYVGYCGNGTLNITNGGEVNNPLCYIGNSYDSTGVVTVDGAGSRLTTSTWYICVGHEGCGTLTITDGGIVSSANGYIGYASGSTGEVVVDKACSRWLNRYDLTVGRSGNGTLFITDGGLVSVGGTLTIDEDADGDSCIKIAGGGMLALCGDADASLSGFLELIDGTDAICYWDESVSDWADLADAMPDTDFTLVFIDNTDSDLFGYTLLTVEASPIPEPSGLLLLGTLALVLVGRRFCYPIMCSGLLAYLDSRVFFEANQQKERTMKVTSVPFIVISVSVCLAGLSQTALAAVEWSGDIDPDDPTTWTADTYAYVGKTGEGTLTVDGGGDLFSSYAYIGYGTGSTGKISVDGVGSTWMSTTIVLGYEGSGTLSIRNGGEVNAANSTWVAGDTGSSGLIHFDDGTLTTGTLLCAVADMFGTGTINANGLISDVDMVFDSTHGLNQTFTISDNPDRNITVNLNVDGTGGLGVGYSTAGTMSISDGVAVESAWSYIGYHSGSTGSVTVDGVGSVWKNGSLRVGCEGDGALMVSSGAVVSIKRCVSIGDQFGSTGRITVERDSSMEIGRYSFCPSLTVGDEGTGTLNIQGEVTVGGLTWVSHEADSSGTIHLDNGVLTTNGLICGADDLTGTGTINTNGLVSDVELVFDATHGLDQTFNMEDYAGQDITIHLSASNAPAMGAGYNGIGTMSISDGLVVTSSKGYVGYKPGSVGEVSVNGIGSVWTTTNLFVGRGGSGTLNVAGGGHINNTNCLVGGQGGLTGTVTVDGVGSIWTSSQYFELQSGTLSVTNGGTVDVNGSDAPVWIGRRGWTATATVDGAGSSLSCGSLDVGASGDGVLLISNGGAVNVKSDTVVAARSDYSGRICFDNGILTTRSLFVAGDALYGAGTINTHGLVSDLDLLFDATHGLERTFTTSGTCERNVTINLNVDGAGDMGAGYKSVGAMDISDGVVVESCYGYIGYLSGSAGIVKVDGAGSTWRSTSNLHVGSSGGGMLNIINGGTVSDTCGLIAYYSGSTGVVSVDGEGATWTNELLTYVGCYGDGTLTINRGGTVSNGYGYIGYESGSTGTVTMDGEGSTWTNEWVLSVGQDGSATLSITDGACVTSNDGYIGRESGSTGEVTVEGAGSTLSSIMFVVGSGGTGVLSLTNGGLVTVGYTLTIDDNADRDSFVNMSTGGMLALYGDAGDSLTEFLDLVEGTDEIRYWDDSVSDWAHITGAVPGEDYTLDYIDDPDDALFGYTLLTVGTAVPEPSTLLLIATLTLALVTRGSTRRTTRGEV